MFENYAFIFCKMQSESPLNFSQTFMHVHQTNAMHYKGSSKILTKICSILHPKVEALKISPAIYNKTCSIKTVLQPVVAVLKDLFLKKFKYVYKMWCNRPLKNVYLCLSIITVLHCILCFTICPPQWKRQSDIWYLYAFCVKSLVPFEFKFFKDFSEYYSMCHAWQG